jgi:hypothetical protein
MPIRVKHSRTWDGATIPINENPVTGTDTNVVLDELDEYCAVGATANDPASVLERYSDLVPALSTSAGVSVPTPQIVIQNGTGGGGGGTYIPTSLYHAVQLPGDQVVTVKNGTYNSGNLTYGEITTTHAATSGLYDGWLILKAETQGGVTIDLAPTDSFITSNQASFNGAGPLTMTGGSKKVLFVGFRFINGKFFLRAPDIAFWYCQFTFPMGTWYNNYPNYYTPGARLFQEIKSSNTYLIGCDVNETGTGIIAGGSENMRIQGCKVHGPFTDIVGGQDVAPGIHPDCFAAYNASTHDLTIYDTSFAGRVGLWDGRMNWDTNTAFASDGPATCDYRRLWNNCSSSNQGFTFGQLASSDFAPNYGVQGTMQDIWCWGGTRTRIDYYTDGASSFHTTDYPTINQIPSRINVPMTGTITMGGAGPTGGLTNPANPATLWRAANPYANWSTYFSGLGLW